MHSSAFRKYLFWAILLFAGVARFKGLTAGLPLHTLYGENDTFHALLRMMDAGTLTMEEFLYPGLAYYIYLPFLYAFYAIGHLSGYFYSIASVPEPSLIFVGRCVSAAMGTAGVYLSYRIGRYFSEPIALLAMAILAAVPQHIEFSHMLRPEIPAIFLAEMAVAYALAMTKEPARRTFWLFGLAAGACFATKYNIGLPLVLLPPTIWLLQRPSVRLLWVFEAFGAFAIVFAATNPYLIVNPPAILFWMQKFDSFYVPMDDYYAKNIVFYYLEFLTRYNYNLPLIIAAILGIATTIRRERRLGIVASLYPIAVFAWMCTYETRRIHGLLPLHPFLALWAASALEALWLITRHISRSAFFKLAYGVLLAAFLFFPYSRAGIQTYLLSRLDNRSKAELWMTNHLPQGSRIALLQFHQIELDPNYFQVQNFSPRDYIGKKQFEWFRQQGFDFVAVSSGQYMRYFVEGDSAEKYRDYFQSFFRDGASQGALILDLTTHPVLIPDYRIKLYSTKSAPKLQEFVPAIPDVASDTIYKFKGSEAALNLPPGYYSLEVPSGADASYNLQVRNLKLSETILQKHNGAALSAAPVEQRFPFAIFPARLNARFALFSSSDPEVSPNQPVRFRWKNVPDGLALRQIRPAIEVRSVGFVSDQKSDAQKPYLLFQKNEVFTLRCTLHNRANTNIAGYVETFLSQVGEPQPWKDFESASETQEFFLEPGQEITIDVPSNTGDLTGDHQLSYWIFTRHDLPFSPQNGGWYTRQIRVDDARLGIHPVYGFPIP